MKSYRFKMSSHKEFDHHGWVDCRKPSFDPATGIGVAHDIVEHFDNKDDSVEEELKALGACLWIRGMNNGIGTGFIKPHIMIGSEIVKMNSTIRDEGREVKYSPRTNGPRDEYESLMIRNSFKWVKDTLINEGETPDNANHFVTYARDWVYTGIAFAKRRYRNRGSWEVMELFNSIRKHVDDYNMNDVKEGDILVIRIDPPSYIEYRVSSKLTRRGRIIEKRDVNS